MTIWGKKNPENVGTKRGEASLKIIQKGNWTTLFFRHILKWTNQMSSPPLEPLGNSAVHVTTP